MSSIDTLGFRAVGQGVRALVAQEGEAGADFIGGVLGKWLPKP